MASSGTALAPIPQTNQPALEQKLKLQSRMRSGAGWILAVSIFSVINSALVFFDAKLHFIVGLGITQIVDGVAHHVSSKGSIAGIVVSAFVAGLFLLFWKFAREGQQWAFIVAMALYAMDALIFLVLGIMLEFGFHVFALYCMYKGLSALNALDKLNNQDATRTIAPVVAR